MSKPKTVPNGSEETLKDKLRTTVGTMTNRSPDAAKKSGIKIRGTGAATKGTMARGPMA